MRILVTGGSGFVGSHTVDVLITRGHEPRVLDLAPPHAHQRSRVDARVGDVCDVRAVREAVRGCDAVIHLAAIADVGRVLLDPAYARRVNVDGTRRVLLACASEGIQRVVFASTVWVYGSSNGRPFVEDDPPPPPMHPYVAGKLAGERLCGEVGRRTGLPTTVARLGIPYGPRARPTTVLATFAAQAADGRQITVAGDGRQSRPFVYVQDLADGIATAALAPGEGTYNLAAAESVSVLALAQMVCALMGGGPIRHTPRRPGDIDRLEVSSERAARELGWRPRVGLDEGVRRYIAWLAETNGRPAAAPASRINGTAPTVARQEPGAL